MSEYNGWRDHETWLVSLYLGGNYGHIADHPREQRIENAAAQGADALKALVSDEVTIDNRHTFADPRHGIVNFQNEAIGSLLNAADWEQLARAATEG